jgi:preprotein translocase subunit SecG
VTLALAALADILSGFVMALFIVVALLMSLVVLLQEGKGGGLSGAFGGAASEAFGVKAGSINRFTAYMAAAFLGLALLHAGLDSASAHRSVVPKDVSEPLDEGPSAEDPTNTTPPGGAGETPPGGAGGEGSGTPPPPGEGTPPPPGEGVGDTPPPPGEGEGETPPPPDEEGGSGGPGDGAERPGGE